jgi:DNA-binding CsgD family transcriptional regulator
VYADQLTAFADWTPPAQPVASSAQARLAAYRGDTAAARRLAKSGIETALLMGSPLFDIQNRGALALAAVSEGDHEGAVAAAAPAWERLPEGEPLDPAMLPFLPEYVEAQVAVGDLEGASTTLAWLEEQARRTRHPWGSVVAARCRGLLRAADGDIDGAEAAFATAASHSHGIDLPPEDARTLLARGAALRRAKRRADARAALEQARAIFEQLGAGGFARRAADELARIGGRAPSSEGLTPAQRKVAELAARGLSNREIANALYISENTVESHLRNIFKTLGVRSRVQLSRHEALAESREL